MSSIMRVVSELAMFCKKADVAGEPRISISFDNAKDAAYFQREVTRELAQQRGQYLYPPQPLPANEFRIYGIHLRIMD